jgi:anaerobic selenocysteine-containing dehydrogenase
LIPIVHTDCLIAWGSNLPEQHPIIYWRMKEAQEQRDFPLIVIDPRVTMLAQNADMHLAITPGTDVVLQNAFMHVILAEGLEDQDYIKANTNGFDDLKKEVQNYRYYPLINSGCLSPQHHQNRAYFD